MCCFCGGAGQRDGAAEGVPGLGHAPKFTQQGAPQPVEVEVAVQCRSQRFHDLKGYPGSMQLQDRDSPVQPDDRGRRTAFQRLIEALNPGPVGVLGIGDAGVQRRDRCLKLVGTGSMVRHRLAQQGECLGDHPAVPAGAALILEQDHGPVSVEARPVPGVLE